MAKTKTVGTGFSFKEIAKITIASFPMIDGVPAFAKIDGLPVKTESKKEEGAFYYAIPVTNLETGEEQVLNADEYTANALNGVENVVGKCFRFLREKVPGKRYRATTITQIEVTSK